ncbi:hypothetical protein NE865_14164 [Phthorimaea operculella]|nr:hypothetical protein NE865_14164 [Phthorimaea operculella]
MSSKNSGTSVSKRTKALPKEPESEVPENLESDQEALISEISDRVSTAIKAELPAMIKRIIAKEISKLTSEIQELRKSINFVSENHRELDNTVTSLKSDIDQLKNENTSLKTTVRDLSDRLNSQEQHLRENNLEFSGIPENRSENLLVTLQQCARVTGHQLNEGDIVNCTRVAKKNKESKLPRSVVVKFRSVRCRDEFFSAVHRYNKANPKDKLNTSLLGIGGDKKPVYVSEHLSPANKSLHAAARKKAADLSYKFVWIRSGRIFVRKTPESQFILIKNEDSLNLIR